MSNADDLFATITDRIIAAIESGPEGWAKCWTSFGGAISCDGRPYAGINAMWLPMAATDKGYTARVWGTYKAWSGKGAQVRKGEKATEAILWKPCKRINAVTGLDETFLISRTYAVFNADQCEGSESIVAKYSRTLNDNAADATCDAFIAATGATFVPEMNAAYYRPGTDTVHVPAIGQFRDAASFYATTFHELGHWTGHADRLARDFSGRFGSDAYAVEELTAELTSAFLCGILGLSSEPRADHASYLAHWLTVLRSDAKALSHVAGKAQAAVRFLSGEGAYGEQVAAA